MAFVAPIAASISSFAAANAPLLSAASMLIGVGQTVAGFIGQSRQASAQNAINARIAEDARRARDFENQQITTRQLQERDAAVERMIENRLAGLKASARAVASADSAGVEGSSIDSLANEYFSRAGRAEEIITRSANNVIGQLEAERRGAQARYEQRIRSLQPAVRPSLIGLGLGIASGVGSGLVGMGKGASHSPAPKTPGSWGAP